MEITMPTTYRYLHSSPNDPTKFIVNIKKIDNWLDTVYVNGSNIFLRLKTLDIGPTSFTLQVWTKVKYAILDEEGDIKTPPRQYHNVYEHRLPRHNLTIELHPDQDYWSDVNHGIHPVFSQHFNSATYSDITVNDQLTRTTIYLHRIAMARVTHYFEDEDNQCVKLEEGRGNDYYNLFLYLYEGRITCLKDTTNLIRMFEVATKLEIFESAMQSAAVQFIASLKIDNFINVCNVYSHLRYFNKAAAIRIAFDVENRIEYKRIESAPILCIALEYADEKESGWQFGKEFFSLFENY